MTDDFPALLAHHRHDLDRLLRARLVDADIPARLREAMAYSLLAPGKRLRPLLTLFACEAVGGDVPAAWPAAVAVEMIHAYSLIHDDLPAMDDDDLRRGRPTCHIQFDEATAILAGDGLLTLAFQVLCDGLPSAIAAAACRELAVAAGPAGMVGGQMDDLAAERFSVGEQSLAGLEHIHRRKTGALFRACLRLGQLAARPERSEPDSARRLDVYAAAFGLAFQIADDLLDVEATPEQVGKRTGKDAGRNKLTYPGFLGLAESRARLAALTREAVEAVTPLGPGGCHLARLAESALRPV